jgi:putative membrane protein
MIMYIARLAAMAAALSFTAIALAQGKGPSDPQIAGIVVAANQKLKVKPEDSDTSRSLKSAAKQTEGKLKGLKGAAFDRAYADNEVAYHQQVLDAIDKVLIPNAQNAELKALLEKVRPAIAAHLDHAKMLASSLGKK